MKPPVARVRLHIDRLVLRGVAPADAAALAEALRGELERLLAAPPATRAAQGLVGAAPRDRLAVPPVAAASPPQLGVRAARAIVSGLGAAVEPRR